MTVSQRRSRNRVAADTAPLAPLPSRNSLRKSRKLTGGADAVNTEQTRPLPQPRARGRNILEAHGATRHNSLEFITDYTLARHGSRSATHSPGGHKFRGLCGIPSQQQNCRETSVRNSVRRTSTWSKKSETSTWRPVRRIPAIATIRRIQRHPKSGSSATVGRACSKVRQPYSKDSQLVSAINPSVSRCIPRHATALRYRE